MKMFPMLLVAIAASASAPALAEFNLQCGPFHLKGEKDGYIHINGYEPQTQRLTFVKKQGDYNNVKLEWMVETRQGWIGLEYWKLHGTKVYLNAQYIGSPTSEPVINSYDCHVVK